MFRKFLAWTSAKLALIHFATRHHAFLSTSSVFYDIFAQAYAKIKLFVSNVLRLFGFLILFPQFFFSFSYLFAAAVAICFLILFSAFSFFLVFLSFCCSCWSTTSSSKIPETGNSYHGVATCSKGIFFSEFTQISKHFWTFHTQLTQSLWSGYHRKALSLPEFDCKWCQFWSKVMDNIRSRINVSNHHKQLWVAQVSVGEHDCVCEIIIVFS